MELKTGDKLIDESSFCIDYLYRNLSRNTKGSGEDIDICISTEIIYPFTRTTESVLDEYYLDYLDELRSYNFKKYTKIMVKGNGDRQGKEIGIKVLFIIISTRCESHNEALLKAKFISPIVIPLDGNNIEDIIKGLIKKGVTIKCNSVNIDKDFYTGTYSYNEEVVTVNSVKESKFKLLIKRLKNAFRR